MAYSGQAVLAKAVMLWSSYHKLSSSLLMQPRAHPASAGLLMPHNTRKPQWLRQNVATSICPMSKACLPLMRPHLARSNVPLQRPNKSQGKGQINQRGSPLRHKADRQAQQWHGPPSPPSCRRQRDATRAVLAQQWSRRPGLASLRRAAVVAQAQPRLEQLRP